MSVISQAKTCPLRVQYSISIVCSDMKALSITSSILILVWCGLVYWRWERNWRITKRIYPYRLIVLTI